MPKRTNIAERMTMEATPPIVIPTRMTMRKTLANVIPTGADESQSESSAEWRDLLCIRRYEPLLPRLLKLGFILTLGLLLQWANAEDKGVPEAVTVSAETPPQLTSSHVRIAVVLDAKPLKGARIEVICKSNTNGSPEAPCFSGLTNDDGIVTPPALKDGDYQIVATLEDMTTFLRVRVVEKLEPMTVLFIDLTKLVQHTHHIQDEAIKRAEGQPIRNRLQVFQGAVVDAGGAVLPGAKVRIMKSGPEGQVFVLGLITDSVGRFSAQLPDGLYLAIFYANAFRAEAIQFEVTDKGSGSLQVTLQIGNPELPVTRYQVLPGNQVPPLAS